MLVRLRMLLALIGCYIIFGFAASLLIPPWQSPDEPAHFEHAMLIPYGTDAELPAVQQPILDSFTAFQFYRFRGYTVPETAPTSFSSIDYLMIRQVNKTPLYYQLASFAASWTKNTVLQLYSMRWLSVMLSAITIPLAFALAREVLPESRARLALLAAAVVALLPMYGYIGASVNPDTLGTPLAAATALFAVRAVRGKQTLLSVVTMLALAGLSIWSRRSAVALAPWAGLLAGALGVRWAWAHLAKPVVIISGTCLLLLALAGAAWPSQLAADWYPGTGTTVSRSSVHPYEGNDAFTLLAPGNVTQQFMRYQLSDLHGGQVRIQAAVRGNQPGASGALVLSDQHGTLATLPVTPTTNWQMVGFTARVPTSAESVYLSLRATIGSVGFDAISATHLDPDWPVVLGNPGAEVPFTWWQTRALTNSFVDYTTRILQSLRMGMYTSDTARSLYPWQIEQMTSSFIGRFGWMAFGPAQWVLTAIRLLAVLLVAGYVRVWWGKRRLERNQSQAVFWLGLLVVLCVVTPLLEYIPYLSYAMFPQGRYLFPCITPLAALLVGGLAQWIPARFDRGSLAGGIGVLLVFNLWCWFGLIVPYFYA